MPETDFKGEDMEAATRILELLPLLVSYQYAVKFDKKFKTIEILTIWGTEEAAVPREEMWMAGSIEQAM